MLKLKLIYTAMILYLTGIEITLTVHILNHLINSNSPSSPAVVKTGRYTETLQKRFSLSETKFISLLAQLSCQQ